ncbi:aldehyde dehydrogenase (NADP(+)) [Streptomyces cyaneofuscatus]|uniref:aldehyde dehydrogenase (NADP(+)) n=1 Tax=Streptomyces TaxID=1883 RepID=UPI0009A18B86|nr:MULTISPECIES: aldehyde dehydrogenase (NADP(+)) [unclassified Streptomyces]ONI48844.1 Alpha-ketoglutaric semialdehyde dehydrogenase [Streptomyces sp. IB2014 011-1]RDV46986.1 aldehyde dehydrogenase (NADP(+)) [Streptomyces sp. IB2014 011-12]CAD5911551.1 Alpha-ketoglutaric semialdehyde dehydrogenase 2 [Streptomyces sp. KY75]CAD5995092.1 Alpha-ketoglutaric semialdehyde dehydrogenase 2 [Streptomyces sp. KY70]
MNLTGNPSLPGDSFPNGHAPLTGHSLLAGREVPGTGDAWYAVAAATGEPFGPPHRDASTEQVAEAARLAAADSRAFRTLPPERRAAFLDACAEEIETLGDALLELAARESGLPPARLTGERGRTCGQLRLFADLVRSGTALGARIDTGPSGTDLRLRRVPLGPVAVFGASNFPLAFSVAGGDTASALAAGCPVVVKSHPAHPGTGEAVARAVTTAAARTGMPAGVFSLLVGRDHDIGLALVGDPRITAVGFTGSRVGGLALIAAGRSRPAPIPVYAEMSAVNPVIMLDGALARPEQAAAPYVASLTASAGQFCTNPGLLLLPAGPAGDAFLSAVALAMKASEGQVMLTPDIARAYTEGVRRWGDVPGVREVARGTAGAGPYAPAPVVLACDAATYTAHEDLMGEVFGAAGLVVRWSGTDELLQLLEELEGQLTATLHGTDADRSTALGLLPVLEERAGRVLWGGWPTGVEVCHAMVHGGPWPATSSPGATSVGTLAVERWLRPVCYQSFPDALLPSELRDDNPLRAPRQTGAGLIQGA